MSDFDILKALELFKEHPYLMLFAFIVIILIIGIITYRPMNKIGNIKARKLDLSQKGLKSNEVKDIDADEVKIKQG